MSIFRGPSIKIANKKRPEMARLSNSVVRLRGNSRKATSPHCTNLLKKLVPSINAKPQKNNLIILHLTFGIL